MMSNSQSGQTSRRQLLRASSAAAALTLASSAIPMAHAAGSDNVQVALVGCGGRGSGAALNALDTKTGSIRLVAMADAYDHRLKSSYASLSKQRPDQVDVPEDRRFVGFDAYRKAIDCLKPNDVVIFATPLAFRWVHFTYAIEKGVNVFMEKPVTADGPTSKRMLALNEGAIKKNLKVGVGLMSRHARNLQELKKRVDDGELGNIICMRGYRMAGPIGHFASGPKPDNISDLDYQIQRFHSMLWAGGGCFSDFNIHIIDHTSWLKGSWPVKAKGLGGRHYREIKKGVPFIDQNFDSYSIEYTYADGTKLYFDGRCMTGAQTMYSSYLHGTKGMAVASASGDCGGPSKIFKGHNINKDDQLWASTDKSNPYQNEWDVLIDAIRNNKPHNEVQRGVEASLATSMGRMAAHTGQEITFDQMLNCDHEFAPDVDKITKDSPAPVMPDKDGVYPQPMPGQKKREY